VTGAVPIAPIHGPVTVGQLAEDMLKDAGASRKRQWKDQRGPQFRWNRLAPTFEKMRAEEVTVPIIKKYIAKRREMGAPTSTCNREISFLERCFSLGIENEKIRHAPKFPRLAEPPARKGFPTPEEYARLRDVAEDRAGVWLRAMIELCGTFGWREGSLLKMRVRNVDLANNRIRQEGTTTKSGHGNECLMTPAIRKLLIRCIGTKKADAYLFSRDAEGTRINFFPYKLWRKVCREPGKPGMRFHDLCRKAARDLSRYMSQNTAQEICGRRTPSIFQRYNIQDQATKDDAISRLIDSQVAIDSQFSSQSRGVRMAIKVPT